MIDVPTKLEEWRFPISLSQDMVKYRVSWGFSGVSRMKLMMCRQLRADFGEDLGIDENDDSVDWDIFP